LTKGRIVANRTIRTPEKEERILCALRERPVFSYACKKARIAKSAFYAWRHDDALFDQAVEDARQEGLDALEDALMDRGAPSTVIGPRSMSTSRSVRRPNEWRPNWASRSTI
jgi:hypothetical protein